MYNSNYFKTYSHVLHCNVNECDPDHTQTQFCNSCCHQTSWSFCSIGALFRCLRRVSRTFSSTATISTMYVISHLNLISYHQLVISKISSVWAEGIQVLVSLSRVQTTWGLFKCGSSCWRRLNCPGRRRRSDPFLCDNSSCITLRVDIMHLWFERSRYKEGAWEGTNLLSGSHTGVVIDKSVGIASERIARLRILMCKVE